MKRSLVLLLTLVILIGCLAGCMEETGGGQSRVITDLSGRKVTIPEKVESILAIPWPWASIVFAVDGTDEHIAAISETAKKSYEKSMFKTLAPGLSERSTSFIADGSAGDFGLVDFSEMAEIDPDLVLIYRSQSETISGFDMLQVPVVVINYGSLDQVHKGIRLLGEILHKEDRAEQIIAFHEETEAQVQALVRDISPESKPSVLYLYNSSLVTQPIGFPVWMIEKAGGINAAADVQIPADATNNFVTLDSDTIYALDPDVIILSNFDSFTPEDVYNNNVAGMDWSGLRAVKNRQVYKIPMGIYRWSQPNAEAHLFMEWLGKLMQPEAFAEVDLRADTLEFYRTMFDYELSDKELDQIYYTGLNPGLRLWAE